MSSKSRMSSVRTLWVPHTRHSRRAVSMAGVGAMIGAPERSRAARMRGDAGLGPADDGAGLDGLGHFMHRRHDGVGRGVFRRAALGFDDGVIERIVFHRAWRCGPSSAPLPPDRRRWRDSADSITASAPSNTAVATSRDFGAGRHGRGDHGFQHLGRHHHRLAGLAGGAGDLLLQARHPLPAAFPRPDRRAPPSARRPVPGCRPATASALGFSILASTPARPCHDLLQFGHVFGPLHKAQRDPVHAQIPAPHPGRRGPWASWPTWAAACRAC